MKILHKGIIQPYLCTLDSSSVGQMCFLECPSDTHRLYFPEDEYSKVGYAGKSWAMEGKLQREFSDANVLVNNSENVLDEGHFEFEGDHLSIGPMSYYWEENIFKARAFFRECLASGKWSGAQASCKGE